MTDLPLSGQTILLTRAPEEATQLNERLLGLGASTRFLPLFTIEPIEFETQPPLDNYDGIIYTSRNAAQLGPTPKAANTICLAVGPGTAAALEKRGLNNVKVPADTRSEGLLALPELQAVEGQRWLVIKGSGGRRFLSSALSELGAKVGHLEVYKRRPVSHPEAVLAESIRPADRLLVFSGDGLSRLVEICPGALRNHLFSLQLVVPSVRVVKMAQELGFTQPARATMRMTDDALVAALLESGM